MPKPETHFRRFLDLSTGHLRSSTREWLDHNDRWPTRYAHPDGHGWFVYVPSDPVNDPPDMSAIPDDLISAVAFARTRDCDFVLFDRDAEPVAGLAYYEDGETEVEGLY